MINEDTVYCVSCSHIIPKEKADTIFRTGYFKAIMRLGLCASCTAHNQIHEDSVSFMENVPVNEAHQPSSYDLR
jgi:ribosomal protein S26